MPETLVASSYDGGNSEGPEIDSAYTGSVCGMFCVDLEFIWAAQGLFSRNRGLLSILKIANVTKKRKQRYARMIKGRELKCCASYMVESESWMDLHRTCMLPNRVRYR